jgi:hypothetical protein
MSEALMDTNLYSDGERFTAKVSDPVSQSIFIVSWPMDSDEVMTARVEMISENLRRIILEMFEAADASQTEGSVTA